MSSTTTLPPIPQPSAQAMAMARRLIREGRRQAFRELYGVEPPEDRGRTLPVGVTKWNARGGA